MTRRSWSLRFASLFAAVLFARSAAADLPAEGAKVPGEARLEARLIAPCCWTQTLDMHESELSSALRREIRARLVAGEPPDAIEDDFAKRHGEKIRAAPRGGELGSPIPIGVGVGMALTLALLVLALRRWLRASAARVQPLMPIAGAAAGAVELDPYESKLDDELRALEEES